ncbi:MAG TPA: hypothetical protein VMS54_05285 [Vicinamibacterales bacterium]|nr:hypothetical protein [Vicinamibacterales bacterium]
MDFLLILVAFGGFVVAIVMLVLASRANRLQRESDERVETLEVMATGSVLFASAPASPDLVVQAPFEDEDDADFALNAFADEDVTPLPARFERPAPAYPFVMTVPAAAGMGRVQVSFDRSRTRSRT